MESRVAAKSKKMMRARNVMLMKNKGLTEASRVKSKASGLGDEKLLMTAGVTVSSEKCLLGRFAPKIHLILRICMKSNKISILALVGALLFLCGSQPSIAQIGKATALVKGDASSSSGKASDVTITTYKGSEVVNKTKLTPEGKFIIVLQPGTQYRLTFSGTKYYFHEEQLSVPASDKYEEVPMHVMLKELEIGKPYTFSNLIFEPKSSSISSNVLSEMENIAAALKRNSNLMITATVYPDETPAGKKVAAQKSLADSRKSALMAFFLSQNIPAANVSVQVSTSVPTIRTFERIITNDPPPAKSKKKTKAKAPAPGVAGKKVMVPQYAEITMQMGG
jgi:hypothetical protein